ncbi:hypothetical protein D3C76_1411900 [compost metagenome]
MLEDLAVDAQLAELVDDHRDAPPLSVVEHVPQQRGFTRAEEAGNDGDGEFGQCFHVDALGRMAGMRDESHRYHYLGAFATGSPRPVYVGNCSRQVSWLALHRPEASRTTPSRRDAVAVSNRSMLTVAGAAAAWTAFPS